MPVDRLFHPRLGDSDKVGKLSELEFRVWFTYILAADDFGVLPMLASKIQAADRALSLRPAKVVAQALERLSKLGLVQTFVHQDTVFMWSANWQHHQKIRYPRREQTHYPAPAEATLAALDGDETAPTRELFATFHMKVTTAFRDKYGDRDAIERIEERDRKRRVKKPRRSSDVPGMEQQSIGTVPTHTHGGADARAPETAHGLRLPANGSRQTAPLVTRRRMDAAFEGQRGIYVPASLHGQFVAQRNHAEAESELQTFYLRVSLDFYEGPRANEDFDPDMFKFWKARYAEKWPAQKPAPVVEKRSHVPDAEASRARREAMFGRG